MNYRKLEAIKSSKFINKLYFFIGSFFMNFIRIFVKSKKNLILFVSFGGKQYNDSPKAIYEAMLEDPRFKDYEIVWAFKNPSDITIPGKAKVIKIDTINYFLTTLKARVWVSNSPIERRLSYKGKNTFYLCTWHGTPIKEIGDENSITYGKSKYDVITAQGAFDVKIFEQAFNIKRENIIRSGLPRNDILVNVDNNYEKNIKKQLNLPSGKKVILYCPTYRDWEENYMNINVNFEKWHQVLGEEYIVLFRTHARVPNDFYITGNKDFVYNVSDYHDLNDLMLASDLLITDYSSLSIDYAILEKPIICYTYDFDKYKYERGMFFDIRKFLNGGSITEDELLYLIKNLSYKENIIKVKNFKDMFVEDYGNASSQSLDIIYRNIQ